MKMVENMSQILAVSADSNNPCLMPLTRKFNWNATDTTVQIAKGFKIRFLEPSSILKQYS